MSESSTKTFIGFQIGVFVEPDDDGFHAYCPALKGLHTYGSTEKEAFENAKYAAIAYLESSIKHNDPIPVGIALEKEDLEESKKSERKLSRRTEELKIACAI